jgi:hypothetical protein
MKPAQHDFGVAMVFGQLLMITHAILQKKSKGFVAEIYKLHQYILNLLVDFTPTQKNLIWADAYEMLMVSFPHESVRGVLVECLAELQERIENEAHQQDAHTSRPKDTQHPC